MNVQEMMGKLQEPFDFCDIEWRLVYTKEDGSGGSAAAYVDNRAIQRRLDEVVGAMNWKNDFQAWHNNAQLCAISIFYEDREEWISKFDGADNTNVEPTKGGLSDSMKRAAVQWGIGRYLYSMDACWVDTEKYGKSFKIKSSEQNKLKTHYAKALKGESPPPETGKDNASSQSSGRNSAPTQSSGDNTQSNGNTSQQGKSPDYKILSIKPSGANSSFVELITKDGKKVGTYAKNDIVQVGIGNWIRITDYSTGENNMKKFNKINSYVRISNAA